MKKKLIEKSKNKSSRSKADLFEILIAIGLCDVYNLKKDGLEGEKLKLETKISKFHDGNKRINEQYKRADILIPELVKILKSKIIPFHGGIKHIDWVGRKWQKKGTLSDIDLIFVSGFSIGLSLKSTRKGSGTQKNIGYKKLKGLLGLNIDRELRLMWKKVRSDLISKGGKLAKIATKSQREIKDSKYDFPVLKKIGEKHAAPVQKLSVNKSIKLFNSLSKNKKLIFLREIFGVKSGKPILDAYVEGNLPKIYWDEAVQRLIKGKILAEKLQNKSYRILANKKPIVRLQASFTNGVGLSAFCERAFSLIKIK